MSHQRFLICILLLCNSLWAEKATILLTGGTGYIGSHIAVALLQNDYDVILVDNLSNSDISTVEKIKMSSGHAVKAFYPYDLLDKELLSQVFYSHSIDAVIHLAGFKSVAESVEMPLRYYKNNLNSTITLIETMQEYGCHRLIFSSSATVYGKPEYLPLDETHPLKPLQPYGKTKWICEEILQDIASIQPEKRFISLRYFNPVGAHPSGLLGENPTTTAQNLVPYMLEVAKGKRPYLNIYGSDYNTIDGTAVRDYIHVMDLATGHVLALDSLFTNDTPYRTYNLYQSSEIK